MTKSSQVVVFDTKGDEKFEYLPASIYKNASKVLKDKKSDIVIYRPDYEDADATALDELLGRLYANKRNQTIYLDETYQVAPNAKIGKGLGNVVMRGRRRWDGKKETRMSLISGTQRPVWVPRFCFTEARHFYIHNLSEADTDTMVGYIGRGGNRLFANPPIGHEFYYYQNASEPEGINYPLQKFLFDLNTSEANRAT